MRHRLFDVPKFTEVDIHMDYFKKAKEKLYSVGMLRRRLKNYEDAYDREIRRTAPSGIQPIDYSKPTVSSSRSDDALDSVEQIAYYKAKIVQTRTELEEITSIVEQLPEEYREIIEKCYYSGDRNSRNQTWRIAQMLHISESTAYRLKKKAITEFIKIFPW